MLFEMTLALGKKSGNSMVRAFWDGEIDVMEGDLKCLKKRKLNIQ